jgi:hypothetical protein
MASEWVADDCWCEVEAKQKRERVGVVRSQRPSSEATIYTSAWFVGCEQASTSTVLFILMPWALYSTTSDAVERKELKGGHHLCCTLD